MTRMTLGLDLDGVLADFNNAFARVLRQVTGRELYGTFTTWEWMKAWGYTDEECARAWAAVKRSARFWEDLTPLADVSELSRLGARLVFVTNRIGETAQEQTERWLRRYGIADPRVILSADKGVWAALAQVDAFIDDKPENCRMVKEALPSATVILLEQPWNVGERSGLQSAPTLAAALALAVSGEVIVVDEKTGGRKGQKIARFDLIPPEALWALAEVYGRGAQKYADRNWELGYPWSLCVGALMRHLLRWIMGERCDPETGCHHLAQVAWHAFALFTFEARQKGTDDVRVTSCPSTNTTAPAVTRASSCSRT